ncbi:low molecular weight protein arginine phosphatase [Paenibacillus flagellatus]|uniref:Low molecular weight phosphatase family protein n=1 Tax=Paenibacillus flagellatus TaxID=2211139 RepID=A0A2V5JXX6_9BACL|nr:low molecular weight protein arginine phosphatase [Paenibacillus flagellatus]PYI51122.1 low molecular weight phosphatase family protein [Paenibacillus flagellatus]
MYERILFVCTGNTCRSPLAEGLFRSMARREGLRLDVRSAGVSAWDGAPISKHSADILKERGVTDRLSSSAVTGEAVSWADLILTMTAGHKEAVIRRYPEAVDKVFTLKEFAEDDPQAAAKIEERHRIHSELQIKRALGQPITPDELLQAEQAEYGMPSFDISDPFGGDRAQYEKTADEIEAYLAKLIRKLRRAES